MFQYYKLFDEAGIVPKLSNTEPYDYVLTLEDLQQMNDISVLNAYPNPFGGRPLIAFSLDEKDFVKLSIMDMTGK